MQDPLRPFMDAVLAYDFQSLGKLLKSFPSEHPLRPCCAVIADSLDPRMDEDLAKMGEVLKALCRLVDSPPADADLLLLVLLRIVSVAPFVGRVNEAQRAI